MLCNNQITGLCVRLGFESQMLHSIHCHCKRLINDRFYKLIRGIQNFDCIKEGNTKKLLQPKRQNNTNVYRIESSSLNSERGINLGLVSLFYFIDK